jgi:lactoylglutathione lyase
MGKALREPSMRRAPRRETQGRKNKAFFFSRREKLTFLPSKTEDMHQLRLFGRTLRFAALATAILLTTTVCAQGPHFSHQTIYVTDLDRAANFYEKVLELKRIAEPFHDGRHVWFRVSEHGQLHVVSGAKEDIPHDINIHLAFSVPDMAAFAKHLDELHVKYGNWAQDSKTPQLRPDKVKQVYLQDPDGYWIEVNDDKF